jgi:F-type H+-transporting ATPase subunit delta
VSVRAQPKDYARAIYDLALETWTQQLTAVQQAVKAKADLRATLEDNSIRSQIKLQQLDQAVPGGLSESVRKFLGTLLEAGELDRLDAILLEFDRLVSHRPEERRLAQVTSAVPLTEQEKQALQEQLVARFGTDLEFQYEVDDSLIGGIHLRVGDRVIDGSVAGKLAALRDELAA